MCVGVIFYAEAQCKLSVHHVVCNCAIAVVDVVFTQGVVVIVAQVVVIFQSTYISQVHTQSVSHKHT